MKHLSILLRLRKDNGFLFYGLLIVATILLVAALADSLPLADPLEVQQIRPNPNGGFSWPPFSPSADFRLGSDALGRDLLSRVIHGARLTLGLAMAVAAIRLILGFVTGMLASFAPEWFRDALDLMVQTSSGLPALIVAVIVLVTVRPWNHGMTTSVVWFIGVLSMLEWPRIADLINRGVEGLLARPFVEGAVAMGCSRWELLFRHLLPHLLPTMAISFVVEMARALLIMGQLAIFNAFVGGTSVFQNYRDELFVATKHPEWGTMLSQSWMYLFRRSWVPLVPAVAFFVTILGFNMLGEGLRRHWEGIK